MLKRCALKDIILTQKFPIIINLKYIKRSQTLEHYFYLKQRFGHRPSSDYDKNDMITSLSEYDAIKWWENKAVWATEQI